MNQKLTKAIEHWRFVAPILTLPKNKKAFDGLVQQLDALLDKVGENEKDPLMGLVDLLSSMVSYWEEKYFHRNKITGVTALKFLMKTHHLTQKDFPEIASQGVMSEILSGRRKLNMRQVKSLAARFHVDCSTFIEE